MTDQPAVNQTKRWWEQQVRVLGNFLVGPPLNSPSLCLPAHLHPPFPPTFQDNSHYVSQTVLRWLWGSHWPCSRASHGNHRSAGIRGLWHHTWL